MHYYIPSIAPQLLVSTANLTATLPVYLPAVAAVRRTKLLVNENLSVDCTSSTVNLTAFTLNQFSGPRLLLNESLVSLVQMVRVEVTNAAQDFL